MIKFDNVSKRFALGNVALDNVSFEIEDQEFVFLVGPSGAGKTTILKLLTKEYLPTSGTIVVDDTEITSKKFRRIEALRRKIGIVFQDFKVLPDKNIFENIAISLKITQLPFKEIKEKVEEVLELVNLPGKLYVFPSQLSAGELQRVAIARAIVGERKIIIADEPTGNLDPKTSWDIMKIFRKLEHNKTIIIATHNMDIVNSMQRRVLIMRDGKLTKDVRKGGYEL